jgi:hypothetical protein
LQEGSYTKLPQIAYSIYPASTYGAINNFTFNFENQYNYEYEYNGENYNYNYVTSNADYNITKDYKISKRLTLKPTLGLNETFQDSKSILKTIPIILLQGIYGSLKRQIQTCLVDGLEFIL